MNWKTLGLFICTLPLLLANSECAERKQTSSDKQRDQQEQLLDEGTSQVGMPAIKNFRERKLLKQILEMRDQAEFITYTYLYSDMTGKLIPFCQSIGYPIPYATQFTAPESVQRYYMRETSDRVAVWGHDKLPQADPNGLYSPSSADGTWVLCKDPNGPDVKPVYVEPKVITLPFKFNQ